MSRLLRISSDLVLVLVATLGAITLRTDLDLPSPDFVRYVPYLSSTALIAITAIGAFRLDAGLWRHASLRDILGVIGVAALTTLGSTAFIFGLNRLDGIARTIPILQFVFIIVVLLAPRLVARCSRGSARRQARFNVSAEVAAAQNVLIVGFNTLSDLYIRSLAETGDESVRVVGLIGVEKCQTGRYVGQLPILGMIEDLPRILSDLVVHGIVVNRIVLAVSQSRLSVRARETIRAVERDHALTLDFLATRISGCQIVGSGGGLLEPKAFAAFERRLEHHVDLQKLEAQAGSSYWRAKRHLDIAGALTLMILLMPIALLAAALAVVDIGFPVLFWQVRLGKGRSHFKLFKFRTMAAAYDPRGVRVADSERLSPIGSLLRRTRLDELPQLWNILVGDMSLIGPRPLLAADQPSFESGRLFVRPGLTGWAQVCGGRDISANDKAVLDMWYIRNASLKLDMQIVAATVRMMLFGERIDGTRIESAHAELALAGMVPVSAHFRASRSWRPDRETLRADRDVPQRTGARGLGATPLAGSVL